MKSVFVVCAFAFLTHSIFAKDLFCFGSTPDQKINVEAQVVNNIDAQIKINYKDRNYTNEQFLNFDQGIYYYNYGDSCTNQYTGLEEYILTIKDKNASLEFSWCDDDGGSGYEQYNLTCIEIK